MRRKFYLNAGLFLFVIVLLVGVHCEEQDFDDGVVEDVQDESIVNDDNGEEMVYESPQYDPKQFYFVDHFDDVEQSNKRWIKSQAKKDDIAEEISKYDGVWQFESPQRIVWKKDKGLVLKSKAKHAAIAAHMHKVFDFKNEKPLIVQYEVQMQDGQECGGSYIKLLSHGKHLDNLSHFNDKTPYTIMFGPDKCGNDIKMHFIFRHVNPINGSIEEKHCRKPKDRLEEPFKDKLPHLYQLVVRPDNTFQILVDHKVINEGSLLSEFNPPVNPPREIDDPEDKKPADWDEREKIPDPTAEKPDDWDEDAPPQIPDPTAVKPEGWLDDEPDMIPDPTASKPEDWDTEIDGEWEAPLVDNPACENAAGCGQWQAPLIPNKKYKGKWRAPLIDNPNYQGKWAARKIPNPDFFEDLTPFRMTPISAVGIELWSMSSDILFDNLIITDDIAVARDFASKSFDMKRKFIAKESKTLWHRLMRRMNYKPGWWALYFLYLLIPASCYVYYLYRRAKEETFMSKMLALANENPLAWKIILVVLIVPLAYSFYNLVSKNGKKEPDADAKKTDAVQPDDEPADEAATAETPEAETEVEAKPKKSKPKKSDLDVKLEDDVEEEVQPTATEASNNETEPATQTATSTGTRKRQVRKD